MAGDRVYGNIVVEGNLTSVGDVSLGKSTTPGTQRNLNILGSSTNIGLDLNLQGTGIFRLPASYEANILSEPRAVVNKAYADGRLAGKVIPTPGSSEDGKVPSYNNTSDQIVWITPSGGGGGITNSAPNFNLMKSDGTNAIDSGLTVTGTSGSVILSGLDLINGQLKIGVTGGPAKTRRLDVQENTTGTNFVLYPIRISAYNTNGGTIASGMGVGTEFQVQTSSGVYKVGSTIEAIITTPTLGSETFDLVFKLMSGGVAAAEAFRIKADKSLVSKGPIGHTSYTVAGVPAASSYTGSTIYVSNESGGAVIAFSDGTNWRRVTDRAIIS